MRSPKTTACWARSPTCRRSRLRGTTVDHRSDIFSLGVLFYELAVGQRPFAGESTALLLSSILKDTPSSVTERRPDLPPELGRLVRRCLAKDPNRRYQSALDLRNELEEIRQDMQSGDLKASSSKAVAAERGPLRRSLWFVMSLMRLAGTAVSPISRGRNRRRRRARRDYEPPWSLHQAFKCRDKTRCRSSRSRPTVNGSRFTASAAIEVEAVCISGR